MKLLDRSKTESGFTLIEVLITIAIISIMFGLAVLSASRISNRLSIAPGDSNLVNLLTSASRRARDGVKESPWGVYFPYDEVSRSLNEAIIFKGSSYATRDTAYDQSYSFSERVQFITVDFSGVGPLVGNDHEVVFDKYTGQTNQYGSVDLEMLGVSRTVIVSSQGFVTREL